jgi:hypothetical protein
MFSPIPRPMAGLFAAVALLVSACASDDPETEMPVAPISPSDSSVPIVVDAGPSAAIDAGTPPIVTPRDTGTPAAQIVDSGRPSAQPDTGIISPADGGAADAAMGDSAAIGGDGTCCPDGKCLCHGDAPTMLTSANGPYRTQSYSVSAGCVYYPTDGKPPYAAVAVSDGLLGSGGCGSFQTGRWGPLYASWGIVTMIVNTGSSDQPAARGTALTRGIAAFKTENTRSGSPLMGKLSGRYGTSGFSMGGGGTSYAAADDKSLLTNVMIMAWGPTREAVTVPTLVICGSSDSTASCSSHGTPFYGRLAESVPKMRVTVSDGHNGQPSAGSGRSGQVGLAFQKVFLENDTRWKPLLTGVMSNATNIR